MNAPFSNSQEAAVASPALTDGPDAEHYVIPDAQLLFHADFKRVGSDLTLTGEDGHRFVVPGYFKHDKLPSLLSPEGAALSGDIVAALAGPQAPGQYAQATAPTGDAQAIGRVATVQGGAVAVRNGVAIALNVGDAVLKGDVIQTQNNSAVGITFTDGTTFSLTSNARMVLNEFVYNPAPGSANSALINLVQGSISFLAGEVAHTGDMRVGTPVATMGIRGTAVSVEISADNGTTKFSVMLEPNGTVGSFNLYDNVTGQVIGTVSNAQVGWIVSPAGPLQVLAQQFQKAPDVMAHELQLVAQVLNVQTIGNAILQQTAPNPNPNPNKGGAVGSSTFFVDNTSTDKTPADQIKVVVAQVKDSTAPLPAVAPTQVILPPFVETHQANQVPTLEPASVGYADTAAFDLFPAVTGTLVGTDPDSGTHLTYGIEGGAADTSLSGYDTSRSSAYGTLFVNSATGAYTFIPNDIGINALAASAVQTFTITVSDGAASTTQALTVTMTGADDTPTLSSVIVTYTDTSAPDHFAAATGILPGADADSGATLTYSVAGGATNHTLSGYDIARTGTLGTFYLNSHTGAYTFVPNDAAINALTTTVTQTFSITVTDDGGLSATSDFTLTFVGASEAPTTSPVNLTLVVANNTTPHLITLADLLLNAHDIDSSVLSVVNLQKVAGNGALVDNHNGTWAYTPLNGDDTSVSFSYGVTDGTSTVPGMLTFDLGDSHDLDGLAVGSTVRSVGTDTFGTRLGDSITGAAGIQTIYAGGGNDVVTAGDSTTTVYGGSGNDVINGSGGANTLYGGSNSDTINGGGGNDVIVGGFSADVLTGGTGSDTFVFKNLADSLITAFDTITDFDPGTDTISIPHALSGGVVEGFASDLAAVAAGLIEKADGSAINLVANGVARVTIAAGADAGTYLLINDGTAGFEALHDAVVKLSNHAAVTSANFTV